MDLGCGDWQFSRRLDWASASYLGLDVVPHILERNRRLYGTATIQFAASPSSAGQLPDGDLPIVKDVFQHVSNASD